MVQHIRACLILLVLTVVLCSVLYPLALLAIGKTLFREQAEGSLLGPDNNPVGSRLIAQPFNGDEYFQPRPSAVSYNASASGASNFGASNPLLRDRVARTLGPIVKYRGGLKKGQPVGPDVETWFQQQPADFVTHWVADHSTLAGQWVKDHPDSVAAWLGKDVDAVKADTDAATKEFFESFVKRQPSSWPGEEEVKDATGKATKRVKPLREGTDVQAYLFDPWLQAHPDVELESVPADLVMSSGSGLDPHITLDNARYQLDRVAAAWAKKNNQDEKATPKIKEAIGEILKNHTEKPLGGLAGNERAHFVNVLEVNLDLDKSLRK